MESKWKIIKEWINLTPRKQLMSVLAVIIFTLGSVIIYYENDRRQLIKDYKRDIDNINIRHGIMVDIIQKKLDMSIERHNKYIETNEKELREMLFSIDKIKENQKQLKRKNK